MVLLLNATFNLKKLCDQKYLYNRQNYTTIKVWKNINRTGPKFILCS